MRLSIDLKDYNSDCIIVGNKTSNNVMEGYFHRILYSSQYFTLNGVYCLFTLSNMKMEKYFQKMKCCFDYDKNLKTINKIKMIENTILDKIHFDTKKNKILRIAEQLKQGFIKIINERNYDNYGKSTNNTKRILLKISGIWESSDSYGVTFKFSLN